MAKGRVQAASTVAERKRLRATLGELKSLKVGPGVKKRYVQAVNFFLWYVTCCVGPLANSLQELDQHAVLFIHAAWNEGEPRSLVADVLSGLLHLLDQKRILPTAWSWLTVWERHEMPQRAAPLSTEMVFAISGLCWHFGLLEMCCLVPVAYTCMLRTAEFFDLRRGNVFFHEHKASLMLCGKTGVRSGASESVVCDDSVALQLLQFLCASKSPAENLYSWSATWFRRHWRWAINELRLDVKAYQPYGLRRGGACEDFATFGDGNRLCLQGRWGSVRTAKTYAQEALRVRQQAELTAAQKQKISYWSQVFLKRYNALSG